MPQNPPTPDQPGAGAPSDPAPQQRQSEPAAQTVRQPPRDAERGLDGNGSAGSTRDSSSTGQGGPREADLP